MEPDPLLSHPEVARLIRNPHLLKPKFRPFLERIAAAPVDVAARRARKKRIPLGTKPDG